MQKLFENWREYTDEPEKEILDEGAFDFLDPYVKLYKRIYKKTRKKYKRSNALKRKAERKARIHIRLIKKRFKKMYKPEGLKGKQMVNLLIDQLTTTRLELPRAAIQNLADQLAKADNCRDGVCIGLEPEEYRVEAIAMLARNVYRDLYYGEKGQEHAGSLKDLIQEIPINFISKKKLKALGGDDQTQGVYRGAPGAVRVAARVNHLESTSGGPEPYGDILIIDSFFWEWHSLYVGTKRNIKAKEAEKEFGYLAKTPENEKGEISAQKYNWSRFKYIVRHEFVHAINAFWKTRIGKKLLSREILDLYSRPAEDLSAEEKRRRHYGGDLSSIQLDKLKKIYKQTLKFSDMKDWEDRPHEVHAEIVALQTTLRRPVQYEELQSLCAIRMSPEKLAPHIRSRPGPWTDTKAYRAMDERSSFTPKLVKNIQRELLQHLLKTGWTRALLYKNLIITKLRCWPTRGHVNILNSIAQIQIDKSQDPSQKGRRKPIDLPAQKIVAENKILKLKLIL
jgi:hypothetical protein